jgi:hypothetical protein
MIFKRKIYLAFSLICLSLLTSCESALEKQQRLDQEKQQRIEIEVLQKQKAEELAFQKEQERIEREKQEEEKKLEREKEAEIERKEKAIYNKYINNSMSTGATPYAYCFGRNKSCSDWGCSKISVKTPYNSDVMVTIKNNGLVVRHAFIRANSSYIFEFPNGTYQAFFYYGKGWNPNKIMKQTDCGTLKGGFITDENFSKDFPQNIENSILSYELVLQENGNFRTKPSNPEEAF